MNPSHVACILDGNGRWVQARGMVRSAGHSHGADAARRIVEAADDMGLEWLSMYVFSTENWARPAPEIAVIMRAIEKFIDVNLESWHRRGMRIRYLGQPHNRMPRSLLTAMARSAAVTAQNTGMTLGRADTVRSVTAESELAGFIAKFAPEMQCRIRGCRAKLEARFPGAVQMVYDNYNFLVIGFGPTRRASDAILSLAAHALGVNLCFLQRGPGLPDPTSILRGSGKVVRTVALDSPDDLDRPDVAALIEVALGLAATRMDASDNGDLVI